MKTLVTGLIVLVAAGILLSGHANGQVRPSFHHSPFTKKDLTVLVKPQPKNAIITPAPSEAIHDKIIGGLETKGAERVGEGAVQVIVSNTSLADISGVTLSLSAWNGQGWTQIGGSTKLTIKAGGTSQAFGYVNSRDELRVKIDVTKSRPFAQSADHYERRAVDLSKEFNLPALPSYEVWYTTGADGQQWIVAYNGGSQSPSWDEAQKTADRLATYGFDSDIANYRGALHVRTGISTRTKSFPTLNEARRFRQELRNLTLNDVGLHIRISER